MGRILSIYDANNNLANSLKQLQLNQSERLLSSAQQFEKWFTDVTLGWSLCCHYLS